MYIILEGENTARIVLFACPLLVMITTYKRDCNKRN